jgi:hypothetical protein
MTQDTRDLCPETSHIGARGVWVQDICPR